MTVEQLFVSLAFAVLGILLLLKPDNPLLPYLHKGVRRKIHIKTGAIRVSSVLKEEGKRSALLWMRILGAGFMLLSILSLVW